ncbi:MAG: hypothetical protein Q7J04_05360, partial [Microcella sp.]|nr:hypothetical protein [Microcella sp.]
TWAPWFPGEPNNFADERCLLTNWFPTSEFGPGLWNDGGCAPSYPYVIEFGGLGTETGPALFDNRDAAPPADPEPELAATGAELMPALTVGSIGLALGLGMLALSVRRRAQSREITSSPTSIA